MAVRTKWIVILIAFAGMSAAGYVAWRNLFEHAEAYVTYLKAPRQGVVGEPIEIVVRGRWPEPGFRLHQTEVTLVGDVIHLSLIGRRRAGAASSGSAEFETTCRLPEVPSMQYSLDVGPLGSVPLIVYRRGSAPAGDVNLYRPGNAETLTAPVVVIPGEPFVVRLEGRWHEGGGALREVEQAAVGWTVYLTAVGAFKANEQVLEPLQKARFTAAAQVELPAPGAYELVAGGIEGPRVLVYATYDPMPQGATAGPILVSSVTAPLTATVGEPFPVVLNASPAEPGKPHLEVWGDEPVLDVLARSHYPTNQQTAHAGTPDESLTIDVIPEEPGILTLRLPDQTRDFTTEVDVRPSAP